MEQGTEGSVLPSPLLHDMHMPEVYKDIQVVDGHVHKYVRMQIHFQNEKHVLPLKQEVQGCWWSPKHRGDHASLLRSSVKKKT